MVKNTIGLPDTQIREKSKPVNGFDKSLGQLIADLVETSQVQLDPPALGMAAPQIGVFKRVFVAKIREKFKAFVNPEVIKSSQKEAPLLEGCFSVRHLYGHVLRPTEVTVKYQDKNGKTINQTLKGMSAKIFQHELDHLNGILFIDHIYNQNGKLFKVEKDKKGKEQLIELEDSKATFLQ